MQTETLLWLYERQGRERSKFCAHICVFLFLVVRLGILSPFERFLIVFVEFLKG